MKQFMFRGYAIEDEAPVYLTIWARSKKSAIRKYLREYNTQLYVLTSIYQKYVD